MSGDPRKLPKDHPVRSRKLPWYTEFAEDKLTPHTRQLFKEYSGIPPDDIDSHFLQIFWFFSFGLRRHAHYARLVSFLKSSPESTDDSKPPPTFLDLGTCLGQDVCALHYDGVSISRLYGSDILPAFESAGHALVKDADRFTLEHFIVGDIFDTDPETSPLAKTAGTWSVVNIVMFLHLFNLAKSEVFCAQILKLPRPEPGSFVIGAQTGTLNAGDPSVHKVIYRHNRETMIYMWKRVGEKLVWADYDLDEMRERQSRASQDQDWEKRNRFFAGKEESGSSSFWVRLFYSIMTTT
ncbi:hypothetical protein POJ06DRAFT_293511 [Lipomyces tetrasporus]|uniref:Methyltransferase domain-containing protein n=1 Tax=Lipomyces tetrasporus TaxID=54092 RepID=A0AAD7QZ86_9ASCO|nr:uncharacterized protein POJ06DRAFT_293511 [Lipomyces tetrasporus]KAJ8103656.1 hypothetical protein POJ06DRAFT_293511 [Lipomyces tetrasporus]